MNAELEDLICRKEKVVQEQTNFEILITRTREETEEREEENRDKQDKEQALLLLNDSVDMVRTMEEALNTPQHILSTAIDEKDARMLEEGMEGTI